MVHQAPWVWIVRETDDMAQLVHEHRCEPVGRIEAPSPWPVAVDLDGSLQELTAALGLPPARRAVAEASRRTAIRSDQRRRRSGSLTDRPGDQELRTWTA